MDVGPKRSWLQSVASELSLGEVAARAGFSDQSQCTGRFKRPVGVK
jgi:hypothetical protein